MPPPPVTPPIGLPIDGGVIAGACFAILYGAKKLLKRS
ncbi:PID-CTERM protein-sorting domain-containing protein [Algibacter lectus]